MFTKKTFSVPVLFLNASTMATHSSLTVKNRSGFTHWKIHEEILMEKLIMKFKVR